MENESVLKLTKALRLERQIAGVRFLAYKQEYEESTFAVLEHKLTFCGMVNKACNGGALKAQGGDFGCASAAEVLGILPVPESASSGRRYFACGLYGSFATARNVSDSMQYIAHKMYGVEVAPLEVMDAADIVIILGNTRQIMRIVQGYAHQFGSLRNLSMAGNQAICSDLVSKPFSYNDINLTLMCKGARAHTKCADGDMGVGIPVQMFGALCNGVLATLNLVETNEEKQRILDGLENTEALGINIEMDKSYGLNAERYRKYCAVQEAIL
ncbi:MAG: hypothetical protein Ta2F_00540 [Termitinemataceae bacterium]|nr:MAG: hypothetical protein Ta2F_00540 [Termitinemataceae bacterium]